MKEVGSIVSRTMNINRYPRTPFFYTEDKINEKNIALSMINHNNMTSFNESICSRIELLLLT